MTDLHERVKRCLVLVFPDLAPEQIERASVRTMAEWDSVATVTLLSVLEEEFATEIPVSALDQLTSYEQIVDLLSASLPSSDR